jgi:hypothetical protein
VRIGLYHDGTAANLRRGPTVRCGSPKLRACQQINARVIRDVDVAEVEWRARRLRFLLTILMVLIYLVLPDHADEA